MKVSKRQSTSPTKAVRKSPRRWSAQVMRKSDALNLKDNIFKSTDPVKIARSLKHSAESSRRKKGTPFQSAMSMLNFYINRAGRNLSARRKKILEDTKKKLREAFNRPET